MTDNAPLDPLKRLGKAVQLAADRVGLKLRIFLADPDLDGDTPKLRLAFTLEEDDGSKPEPKMITVDDFGTAWGAAETEEQKKKADEARKKLSDLEERLRDPKKGILDDE